jgi:hypothetical protein
MEIISEKYFEQYKHQLQSDIDNELKKLKAVELTPKNFTFYTSIAVISSSRIEGEQMEVDSYLKHKMQNIEYLPELVEKPNDLFQAYLFAREINFQKKIFCKVMHYYQIICCRKNGEEFTVKTKCW